MSTVMSDIRAIEGLIRESLSTTNHTIEHSGTVDEIRRRLLAVKCDYRDCNALSRGLIAIRIEILTKWSNNPMSPKILGLIDEAADRALNQNL